MELHAGYHIRPPISIDVQDNATGFQAWRNGHDVAFPSWIFVPPQVRFSLLAADDDILFSIAVHVSNQRNVNVGTGRVRIDDFVAKLQGWVRHFLLLHSVRLEVTVYFFLF